MSNVDDLEDDMRDEYDLSGAVRTDKYAIRYSEGTNVVLIDPDLADAFPDSQAVNDALRLVLKTPERERRAS